MSLSEMKVRNAKPKEKFYKLADGDGLHLYVTEKGSKLWRFRYQVRPKRKAPFSGYIP